MIKSNFHTHTVYCDGKNTPEEMVLRAIELGFDAIGFSGHSYFPYDDDVFMDPDTYKSYRDDILALKEKYADKIRIYLGIEWDIYSPDYENCAFDYSIGSVHALKIDGKYYPIDLDADETLAVIKRFFGDYDSFAKAYFETVKEIPHRKKVDFIGHVDLCSKYSEIWGIEQSDKYL